MFLYCFLFDPATGEGKKKAKRLFFFTLTGLTSRLVAQIMDGRSLLSIFNIGKGITSLTVPSTTTVCTSVVNHHLCGSPRGEVHHRRKLHEADHNFYGAFKITLKYGRRVSGPMEQVLSVGVVISLALRGP